MSSAHDGHKPSSSSPFGGSGSRPFRSFFQKSSTLSPKLQALLNTFEQTLQERFKSLMMPKDSSSSSEVLTLSWMRSAVESLSNIHVEVKSLITDLEFPLADWDDQWMDMYLDNSVKLLDMCITLSSQLSRLDQGQLFLQYALHSLEDLSSSDGSMPPLERARRSLCDWASHISSRSLKLDNSFTILQDLTGSLHPASKLKSSAKGKVLMQAMYGVKVQTVFVCGVLAAALSGSQATLLDVQVPDKFLWSQAFRELQSVVYAEVRRSSASCRTDGRGVVLLREFEAVCMSTDKLLTVLNGTKGSQTSPSSAEDETKKAELALKECILGLRESAESLSVGMDRLSKQVNSFFQIVLTSRDALLSNLRMPGMGEGNVK